MSDSIRPLLVVFLLAALLWAMRQAAGRLAPKVAIAPLLFLVTRTPVLIAWLLGTAVWLVIILPQAIARGNASVGDLAMLSGICALCGLGFAALAVGPVFMIVRLFAKPPTLTLDPGEEALRSIAANHWKGGEARGGKLHITTRGLRFVPHRFNVQLDGWQARYEDIRGCAVEGSRFLLVDAGGPKPEWLVVMSPPVTAELVRAVATAPEPERAAVHARFEGSAPAGQSPFDGVRGQF